MSDEIETIGVPDQLDKQVWDARVRAGAMWGDIATRYGISVEETGDRFRRYDQWTNPAYGEEHTRADLLAAYRHLDTVAAKALAEAQIDGDTKAVNQAVKLRLDVLDRVASTAGAAGPGSNRLADAIAAVLDAGARRLADSADGLGQIGP